MRIHFACIRTPSCPRVSPTCHYPITIQHSVVLHEGACTGGSDAEPYGDMKVLPDQSFGCVRQVVQKQITV